MAFRARPSTSLTALRFSAAASLISAFVSLTNMRKRCPPNVGVGQEGEKPIAAAVPDAKPTRAHEKALALIDEMRREGPR